MKISFDKKLMLDNFLTPLSRVSDDCSIKMTSNKLFSLVGNKTTNVILYCALNVPTGIPEDEEVALNVPEIRKLNQVFNCINSAVVDVEINDNASLLRHKSPGISFKLHLVNDIVIEKCTIGLKTLNKMEYDSEFDLTGNKIAEILKGGVFASETEKVYFFTKDDNVYAELTDKSQTDIDEITYHIASEFEGSPINNPLPFSLDMLRLIVTTKPDTARVKVNTTYGFLVFEILTPETEMRYVISAFTK